MKKIKSTVTAGLASLGLVVGTAGFAGAATGTINTTGPDSYNRVEHRNNNRTEVKNNNDVRASNTNNQGSYSGYAKTKHNTTGGGASTGHASNSNSLNASVKVNNSASSTRAMPAQATSHSASHGGGTITHTGPDSTNVVKHKNYSTVEVENNNDIQITNDSAQNAVSGDAWVTGNTTGGSATTGNASNNNSTTMTVEVSN
jgi:hypothetical protein